MGRLREVAVAVVYGIMRPLVPRLPRRVFYRSAAVIGYANYHLHGELRRTVRRNMRTVYAGLLQGGTLTGAARGSRGQSWSWSVAMVRN